MTTPKPHSALVKATPAAMASQAGGKLLTQRLNALGGLLRAGKDLFDAAASYGATRERERTRRTAIVEQARVELARIHGETAVLSEAVRRTFDERARVLTALLAAFEQASDQGDQARVDASLGALVAVAGHSPLGDLARFHRARRGEAVEI